MGMNILTAHWNAAGGHGTTEDPGACHHGHQGRDPRPAGMKRDMGMEGME